MRKFKKIKLNRPTFQYESRIKEYPNIISLAKNDVPEWYKKIPKWKNNEIYSRDNGFNHTVKQCLPFLESLTAGYLIKTPFDIYVKNNDGVPYMTWKNGIEDKYMPSWRNEVSDLNLVPAGYIPFEYTWKFNCSFKVPKEYSILITHPLNRNDLPFITLSAIVDGDFAIQADGSTPFYIKKNFEGIIPQGTPIAQLIPFYNESWLFKSKKDLIEESKDNKFKSDSVISGYYKKNFWKRKDYN